jgi:hypothetical protein
VACGSRQPGIVDVTEAREKQDEQELGPAVGQLTPAT